MKIFFMSTELTANTLIPLSVLERKALVLEYASTINATHISDESLHLAYQYGKVISLIAEDYFEYQIKQDSLDDSVLKTERQSELIKNQTEIFTTEFIDWLAKYFEKQKAIVENNPNPRNLYELCGANLLVTSNSVTRQLNTKMGMLWEKISNISPYALIPEFEFDIKITGVDIIILSNETVYFTQLKSQKNTLTGSQAPRAKKELGIHTVCFLQVH
ncbi:hypothetical protein NIES267_33110 [Calothrix parasitica NIES-267]|uniref:Uncharacterized protein n=1 Tax=Calothrix parasitica NIES-267 TaxID=1973488 RepID=A0A1Z4LRH4_9CYAN|nr:hypothetical protein NIES267_33110 [Calothrix parasitica NIES-267]